jgi:DNA-binding CsgD family transcriptional regulator
MLEMVNEARAAFERQDWAVAWSALSAADDESGLAPEDLARLATSAYLLGKDAECESALARAYNDSLSHNQAQDAARSAFWLGFFLMTRGAHARGGGWLARANRLLADTGTDCVECGYVLVPLGLRKLAEGDPAGAKDLFGRAAEFGERYGDHDLIALGRLGTGQALIRLDHVDAGIALLDETMLAVEAGDVSPVVAGTVYCAVIEACDEVFDLQRAQEWTAALSDWCAGQPDMVPYRGQCLVRRSEILRLHGAWDAALTEVRRACEQLAARANPAARAAFYEIAELHRLRGAYADAEAAYREAGRRGRKPYPGLALLRLAQGRTRAAATAVRREMNEANDRKTRARLLPAYIEIMLEDGDVAAARDGADELARLAGESDAPLTHALAAHAQGQVLLANGDVPSALDSLRSAWNRWEEIDCPYESARVRLLIALACQASNDDDTASMEFDFARAAFERLGAEPDVARVDQLRDRSALRRGVHGLSPRELDVLRLIAVGQTNKDIAGALDISDRTVERHVSNIFTKLRVNSRTAAAAHAFEHDLVSRERRDG